MDLNEMPTTHHRGTSMILQDLFRLAFNATQSPQGQAAAASAQPTIKLLAPGDLRSVVGGPEVRNGGVN